MINHTLTLHVVSLSLFFVFLIPVATGEVIHFPFKDLCAPGFVPLGEVCVLNDRCGAGVYVGKICIIDGKTQPYLKPLHQGYAGISSGEVICAEGLELIFKSHDGSPTCVKPLTVTKLKDRGWQVDKPVLACTKEYNPVCGVDKKTYGNTCMVNAEHIAIKHKGECEDVAEQTSGVFDDIMKYTKQPAEIDSEKGYFVAEIADDLYWLAGSGYQTMFLTTGDGVIVVDAPQPISEKYISAIKEVTNEPITHMIYSHHHQDHTGAAGQIFPNDITYIAHKETADVLITENDPNRPIPTVTFEDDKYTLTLGQQTLELYHIGNFHSNGDIVIYAPKQKVVMVVDLLRPGITPYRAFAVTPDIDQYIKTHDILTEDFDFDVLISGHTQILATKEHIKTNKQFTLDVMENARKALQVSDSDAIKTCRNLTIEQWTGKLGNLDEFMTEHCTAMINYLSQ